MGNNPMMKSLVTGTVLQVLMVVIGKFVPAIGAIPNFYAIAGTVLAAVTGWLFNRWSPGASAAQTATGGAVAGGATSILGGIAAVATGQWPDFAAIQMAFPAITGAVAGVVGGFLSRAVGGKVTA